MGVVVRARHTTLDQVVAIKLLVVNRFATREESVARFLAEARAAAAIESDFVCRVFDVGLHDDPNRTPYMVMEHLEGHDLDEEIQRRGQVDLSLAVDYVLEAADALASAHALGIVHRDIKPSNLFLALRPDGTYRMKVLDFGISKLTAEMDASGERSSLLVRRESTSLGTPAYMSPEQVRAEPDVDARTDIWGLGAILYELITGHMAFVGKDVQAILDHVLTEAPCPIDALRRDVPRELEQIVMRCLDRDRYARWASAARFAKALAPFGSSGVFTQLASVQRALGSSASIRVSSMPSVQPMVAPVRPSYVTLPEFEPIRPSNTPEEFAARESIVDEWSKLRARKRTARSVMLGMLSATFIAASVAILLRASADHDVPSTAHAATAAPPPPAVDSSPIVIFGATTAPAATAGTRNDAAAPLGSVYPANTSVHSARVTPSAAPTTPPPAPGPAHS